MKTLWMAAVWGLALGAAGSAPGVSASPGGMISFNSGPLNQVVDDATGVPIPPGVALVGLYYSTNLQAMPRPDLPEDDFLPRPSPAGGN